MILIFFGPPGAGKGTQAKYISQVFKIAHLSTGEILRDQLKKENQLAFKLAAIIDSGKLVSDEILNSIISERIKYKDCNNGFVLDGYPRTMEQGVFLTNTFLERNLTLNRIIDFNIDKKTIIKRIKSRSLKENRQDDNEEVIETRVAKYYSETKPISEYYKSKYSSIYETVNGNQEIEKLNEELIKMLKNS